MIITDHRCAARSKRLPFLSQQWKAVHAKPPTNKQQCINSNNVSTLNYYYYSKFQKPKNILRHLIVFDRIFCKCTPHTAYLKFIPHQEWGWKLLQQWGLYQPPDRSIHKRRGTYHTAKWISCGAPIPVYGLKDHQVDKIISFVKWGAAGGGHLWTKFVVPSNGSTIHVGASVNSGVPSIAEVSSPINCENMPKVNKTTKIQQNHCKQGTQSQTANP